MKTLLLVLALFIASLTYSQMEKVHCAQGTDYVPSGKNGNFRIITSNEAVTKYIISNFNGKFLRVSMSQKKDRNGSYYQYDFTFPAEQHNAIAAYINALSKIN